MIFLILIFVIGIVAVIAVAFFFDILSAGELLLSIFPFLDERRNKDHKCFDLDKFIKNSLWYINKWIRLAEQDNNMAYTFMHYNYAYATIIVLRSIASAKQIYNNSNINIIQLEFQIKNELDKNKKKLMIDKLF